MEEHFIKEGAQIYPLPVKSRFDVYGMIKFAMSLRQQNINCLLLGDGTSWNSGAILRLLSGIPCLWAIVHMTHIGLEIRQYGFLERLVSRLYDYTWALSCDTIIVSNIKNAQILTSEGVSKKKIQVIPNCVDYPALTAKEYDDQEQLRKKYGIDSHKKIVGMLARLGPGKDFATLFRAISAVTKSFPDCVFMLVGTGPYREQLEQEAAANGVSEHILFTGWVEDAFEYIDLFDVFVFSTMAEGIPYSILEAMAFAKPIVSTDNGAISEAIITGKAGILVPPKDSSALADSLLDLLKNPEKARLLGNTARKLVREKFDIPIMLKQFNQLFSERIRYEN